MDINSDRFNSALDRNIAETSNAILKRRALIGIFNSQSAHGLDFFRVAEHALYNDLLAHAMRVFDTNKGAASFWYLEKCDHAKFIVAAVESKVDLEALRAITKKLRRIRNKTHFHIDKEAVTNPKLVWSLAEISGDYLGESLESAFKLLAYLAFKRDGIHRVVPDYDGSDVPKIIRAYKQAHPEVPIAV